MNEFVPISLTPEEYQKWIEELKKSNGDLEIGKEKLKNKNKELENEKEQLKSEYNTLASKYEGLERENKQLERTKSALENRNFVLGNENKILKNKIKGQSAKISQEVAATDSVQNERNAKLKEENDDLKKENTELKAENNSLKKANEEQKKGMAEKADKADLVALRLRLENLQRLSGNDEYETERDQRRIKGIRAHHNFSTCLFLCAILLFNIFAIWFIACRPAVSDATGIRELPWMFLLFLCATLVVNIVWAIIVSYRAVRAGKQRAWVGISAAIVLLVLNMVAVWLFAFHPVELTAAVYALLVFLMVANIAEGAAAIFYSYGNENGFIPSIFAFIALLPVLIIFIGWIRA